MNNNFDFENRLKYIEDILANVPARWAEPTDDIPFYWAQITQHHEIVQPFPSIGKSERCGVYNAQILKNEGGRKVINTAYSLLDAEENGGVVFPHFNNIALADGPQQIVMIERIAKSELYPIWDQSSESCPSSSSSQSSSIVCVGWSWMILTSVIANEDPDNAFDIACP